MKKTQIKSALCATGLAFAATSGFAQAPFTPVVPAPRATAITTTTPVVVRLADGARVMDIAGAPVGRIENIVMSPVGCAEAALVASTAGRIIPVPWTLIRSSEPAAIGVTPGVATFTVNVEQARLAQAPSFTRAQLPDMTTTTWLQPSIAFFNVSASSTATGAAGAASTISGGASTSTSSSASDASGSAGAGVSITGGTNSSSSSVTSTNAAGGTGTGSATGNTGTGGSSQDRFGSTATGGTNQSRFGSTATRVGTNSSSILPPTGRPTPARPPFDQPNTPPTTPNTPASPDSSGGLNNSPSSPASPTAPPSSAPTPRPAAPRSSPSTQP